MTKFSQQELQRETKKETEAKPDLLADLQHKKSDAFSSAVADARSIAKVRYFNAPDKNYDERMTKAEIQAFKPTTVDEGLNKAYLLKNFDKLAKPGMNTKGICLEDNDRIKNLPPELKTALDTITSSPDFHQRTLELSQVQDWSKDDNKFFVDKYTKQLAGAESLSKGLQDGQTISCDKVFETVLRDGNDSRKNGPFHS